MPSNISETHWSRKKRHYQSPDVVREYDNIRFGPEQLDRTSRRKWQMIMSALGGLRDIRTVLDLPCGTGRFSERILAQGWTLINGDISLPMLQSARQRLAGVANLRGSMRLDAEQIPLADASVDLVLCIRFLMHVPRDVRVRMYREFARVTRQYVVMDVRHKFCINLLWKQLRRAIGMKVKIPENRNTYREIVKELQEGGLRIRRSIWNFPPFSEKLVLLCEPTDRS